MAETGLVASRALAYVAMLIAAGLPFQFLGTEAGVRKDLRFTGAVMASVLTAMAASVVWALHAVASMAGMTVGQIDPDLFRAVLGATPLGMVLAIRLTALLLALWACWRGRTGLILLSAGLALATAAWTGHAGATEGTVGPVHRISDVLHLLAASAWIGGILFFVMLGFQPERRDLLAISLHRFAVTGTVIVVVLLVTGVVNTLVIAGWQLSLESRWAALLALKLGLFTAMLGLAALNRWRLTPRLIGGHASALAALRLSLLTEAAAALAVVAVVAWLGTLAP